MTNIFTTLTDYMVEQHIIPAEDHAIYQYGLQQGFVLLLNILTILALGLLNHMLPESVIFPFRLYAATHLRWRISRTHTATLLFWRHCVDPSGIVSYALDPTYTGYHHYIRTGCFLHYFCTGTSCRC